jgi:hypothetical protein
MNTTEIHFSDLEIKQTIEKHCASTDVVRTKRLFRKPRTVGYYATRFWSQVDMRGAGECWGWNGAKCNNGYGKSYTGESCMRATKITFELFYNRSIGDLFVLHKCDNPPCCNPNHLFLGTKQDNTNDMKSKGRARGGSSPGITNPSSKLTEDDVRFIKREFKPGCGMTLALATRFNVSGTAIYQVVRGLKWKYVSV